MQVTLHIGCPKTGSTAIQSHVYSNRAWFHKRGLYIPVAGLASGIGHAYLLGHAAAPFNHLQHSDDPALEGQPLLSELVVELEQASADGFSHALLTWEGFMLADDQAILLLAHALRSHEVTLLVYVRDQVSLFESSALQAVKELRYVKKPLILGERNRRDIAPARNDFHQLIRRWESLFDGALAVRVRVFDRHLLVNCNIIHDFLHVMGIEIDEQFALQRSDTNASLDFSSAAQLVLSRRLLIGFREQLVFSRALSAVVAQLGPVPEKVLEDEEADYIRATFESANERLFAEYSPENVDEGCSAFPESASRTPRRSPPSAVQRSQLPFDFLSSPPSELWQGEILVGRELTRILRRPSTGWLPHESDGTWSSGEVSQIVFRIPTVHRVVGPRALLLTLSGSYLGQDAATIVCMQGAETLLNLEHAEIEVPLDQVTIDQGVKIILRHSEPTLPAGDRAETGKAFKLEFMSYKFLWD